jgi:hypothetical protein
MSIHWMGYLWTFLAVFLAIFLVHQFSGQQGGV